MTRIFVVGSVNVDLVMQLPRMPTLGETVLGGIFMHAGGGKGANQAAAASLLGCETVIVAAVGSDSFALDALDDLQRYAVDVSAVVHLAGSTGVAVVVVDKRGQNIIGVASGVNAALSASHVRDALRGRLAKGDVVVGNLEVSDDALLAAGQEAKAAKAWFVLNPAPARRIGRDLLAICDVLTPNELEVRDIGLDDPSEAFELGVGAVVVTQGAAGADLYRPAQRPLHQIALPVTVVDTTGAGDAFTAGFAAALAGNQSLEQALQWGAAAGSLATRSLGARAGCGTRQELLALLEMSSCVTE